MSIENENEPNNRENRCLVPEHQGSEPYFRVEDKQPQKLAVSGSLNLRTPKPKRVVNDPGRRTHNETAIGDELNRIYPHAIEIGNVARGRYVGVIGSITILILVGFVGFVLVDTYQELGFNPFAFIFYIGLVPLFLFFCLIFFYPLRQALWGPHDAPILFNRKTREVIAFHLGSFPFLKFWGRRKTWTTTGAWDQVKVRTYEQLAQAGGFIPTTVHKLNLLWGYPDDPLRLAGYAQLGSYGDDRDDGLFKKWEFVRRYMEEDGPAIPPGGHLGPGYDKPNLFPPDVIEAAGGAAYSREKVNAMAEQGEFKTE